MFGREKWYFTLNEGIAMEVKEIIKKQVPYFWHEYYLLNISEMSQISLTILIQRELMDITSCNLDANNSSV